MQMQTYAKVFFYSEGTSLQTDFIKKTATQNFVRNGFLDSAHVFTLGKIFEPFGTSTQINLTYLLDYIL